MFVDNVTSAFTLDSVLIWARDSFLITFAIFSLNFSDFFKNGQFDRFYQNLLTTFDRQKAEHLNNERSFVSANILKSLDLVLND